jgi:hypothetical protein
MEKTELFLPKELYRAILESGVSKNDLCSVARASRFMQREAERVLYRDISATSREKVAILCRRLLLKPVLLRHVHTIAFHAKSMPFVYSGIGGAWPFEEAGPVFLSFYLLIMSVLQKAEGLRHLDIGLNASFLTTIDYCAFILQRPCPFKLLSFNSDYCSHESMLNFLATQPTIRDLDLPEDGITMRLPNHILPNLAVLRSNAEHCRITMERRPKSLTHLRIRSLLEPVGFSLASLKAIGASFITTSLPKLAPALETLSVFNLTRPGVSYKFIKNWFALLINSFLRRFSKLATVATPKL